MLERRDHENAERLEILAEASELRGGTMGDLMSQFGIYPEQRCADMVNVRLRQFICR